MDFNISKTLQRSTQKLGNTIFIMQAAMDNHYKVRTFIVRAVPSPNTHM